MFYRLLHLGQFLYKKGFRRFSRFIDNLKRFIYSCDIPSSCDIDRTVKFSHSGLGVVVHANARIEADTSIQPHVVIGKAEGGIPIIEKNCYIGTGAILIGDILIGENSKVGAGAVVIDNVAAGDTVIGVPAHSIKQ